MKKTEKDVSSYELTNFLNRILIEPNHAFNLFFRLSM